MDAPRIIPGDHDAFVIAHRRPQDAVGKGRADAFVASEGLSEGRLAKAAGAAQRRRVGFQLGIASLASIASPVA